MADDDVSELIKLKLPRPITNLENHTKTLPWRDSETTRDVFFGQNSTLIKAVEAAVVKGALLPKIVEILKKAQTRKLAEFLENPEVSQSELIFQGILNTCLAGCQWVQRTRSVTSDVKRLVAEAAQAFDSAWKFAKPVPDLATPHPMIVGQQSSAGLVVVSDLLERLFPQKAHSASNNAEKPRTARTPVLLYKDNSKDGHVADLEIELIKDTSSVFVPDVYWMGCMAIRQKTDAFADDNLMDSMQRIWRASGLNGYRGRWRITTHVNIKEKRIPFTFLHGRSLETATLCALWAANGGIPGDTTFTSTQPMRLASDTAVSAKLPNDIEQMTKKPSALLGKVGHLLDKEEAARKAGLHAAFFSTQHQEEYENRTKPIEAPEESEKSTKTLRVAFRKTVDDALQSLLISNRYLTALRKKVREDWRGFWKGDSGLASFDPEPQA